MRLAAKPHKENEIYGKENLTSKSIRESAMGDSNDLTLKVTGHASGKDLAQFISCGVKS